jgi:4-hydroxy-2-oxoglutarate aldolase
MTATLPAGILAPVATTFKPSGELDLDRFAQNLEVYAQSALDGVVLLGSNGEFATLDVSERMQVIERGTSAVAGRRTVMAGTGKESTRATIEMTRAAAELGVDYALVVTPHYYRTRYDRQAYLSHYLAVAEASPIPILIYVMAAYTGIDLAPEIVIELSKHPNIVGIKDSGGNAARVGEILTGAGKDFAALAGSANFLYAALCLGATGGILALGNIAPDQCASIMRDWRNGDHAAARVTQLKMIAPNAAVTSRFGIAGLKGAMDFVGLCGGDPRPPLLPLTPAERTELERTLAEAGIGRLV